MCRVKNGSDSIYEKQVKKFRQFVLSVFFTLGRKLGIMFDDGFDCEGGNHIMRRVIT